MLKGYRTVLITALLAVAPVLQGAGVDLGLSGTFLSMYTAMWSMITIYLRSITDTPIGKK